MGRTHTVRKLTAGCFDGLDLVFFSSGDDISREWAPLAVSAGAYAVDNSGAFRMRGETLLVVPEVNGDLLSAARNKPQIISNPNCSTIQLVVALQPILKTYGIERVNVASYQSVSGAGRAAVEEMLAHTQTSLTHPQVQLQPQCFTQPIAFNCVPQIGSFQFDNDWDGYCTEEIKIVEETKKIMRMPNMAVSSFTVRVPTRNAHAEAVWVRTQKPCPSVRAMEDCIQSQAGVKLVSTRGSGQFPTQIMASGTDPVYVGRVRRDVTDPQTWLMWIVADNLRKGAALNGIQIAEIIFQTA